MRVVALLRGVTPVGKNRIPKMKYLVEILENVGFKEVDTYIQSGNILLETNLSCEETAFLIHKTILEKIGANLSVIIKTKEQLAKAIKENPFFKDEDYSRIHLVFTNDQINNKKLQKVKETDFNNEIFEIGTQCFYMYLPRYAEKKKLNNNYLEKHLGIVSTMRKINVVQHLYNMLEER